jgi:LysM repeat protein
MGWVRAEYSLAQRAPGLAGPADLGCTHWEVDEQRGESTMTRMHTRIARVLAGGAPRRWLAAAALLIALWFGAALLATPDAAAQTATPAASATYVVQPGDSWTSVSRKTGLTIRELQAANPNSVRASGWLIVGEELVIPGAATPSPAATPSLAATPAATVITQLHLRQLRLQPLPRRLLRRRQRRLLRTTAAARFMSCSLANRGTALPPNWRRSGRAARRQSTGGAAGAGALPRRRVDDSWPAG